MNKKVLIIANYNPNIGGISGQVELLYKNLLKEGFYTAIFSTKGNIFYRLFSPLKLLFAGRKFDIFHIHAASYWGFLPAVIGIIIGKILKKRIILTYHGGGAEAYFAKSQKLVRYFLSKTDANIVLSGFLAKVFAQYKIPYHIIPNILELKENVFKKRTAIHPHFISVRSLTPTYNIGCIIKAFEIVQKQIPESKLDIVGDGISRNELELMVEQREIKNVSFFGRVKNEDIYASLDKADIFISSPVVDNQPMSILEAFNAGLLVISSNVGGVPYMVDDGKTGLLFESNNHVELSERMIWAINNPKTALEMIESANKTLSNYSWAQIKQSLFELYQN